MLAISQCYLQKPITCSLDESIISAAKKLKKDKLRHLYVVDSKKNLVGVFSALDVVYEFLAEGKDYRKLPVKTAMKADIVSFTKEEPVTKAFGFMSQTSIFSCPILKHGKLIGVLAYKDAMTALLKQKKQIMQHK